MSFFSSFVLALAAVVHSDVAPVKCDANKTFQFDAVELVNGNSVQGRAELAVLHHRFAYYFANEANRAAFLKNPEIYEVQMGGACGSMGPLSGDGSTSIHAVHAGRIYVFASEGCRKRFVSNPERCIEVDEPVPAASAESLQRGRELLARAVEAIGGAARLDAINSYTERFSRTIESGNTAYRVVNTTTFLFPDGVREHECWNDGCWSHTASGDAGWMQSKNKLEPLHPQQLRALRRWKGRHILTLLRARNDAEFVALGDGARDTIELSEGEKNEVEWLTIAHRGANTKLAIETTTGRVRAMRYHGRGLSASIDDVQMIYSNFHDLAGLSLPKSFQLLINGKPQVNHSGTFESQTIDHDQDRDVFSNPLLSQR